MSKQSSLDWLIDQVHSEKYQNAFGPTYISLALIVEAEQMHKEEIEDAFCKGAYVMAHNDEIFPREEAEEYYKKTFEQPVTNSNDLSSPKTLDN